MIELIFASSPYKDEETDYPYEFRASTTDCFDDRDVKKYQFTLVGLESKEVFTLCLVYNFNMGCRLDCFCNEVLYHEYWFYKDNLLSLRFLNQPAYKIFESGLFTEEIPVIEHGPKRLYWKRAFKCVMTSLWNKIIMNKINSWFKSVPNGYQPLYQISPDYFKVQVDKQKTE